MKFLRIRPLLLIALILVGITLLALGSRLHITSVWQSYRFEKAMQNAEKCTNDTTGVIACARPYLKTVMDIRPASEVLDELERRLSSIRCHYLGHVIGQELYRKYQNDELALGQCNTSCTSACSHGVVSEAFIQTAGLSENDFDPAHLNVEELQKIGARLCTGGSCHGVGHAFFQAYHSFGPALARCREVASGGGAQECMRGVFMEYSNILTARSAWEDAATPTDIDSLYTTCSDVPDIGREPCYFYFPGMILGVLQRQVGTLGENEKIDMMHHVCDEVPDEDKNLCVSGVGVHFYSYLLMGSPEALRICETFPESRERAACAFGMLSLSLETGDLEQKFAYCRAMSLPSVRQSCLQSFFHIIGSRTPGKIEKARSLCKEDGACIAAANSSAQNPFDYISATIK